MAEVLSGDSLVIRVGSPQDLVQAPWLCDERRIHLSSIRAPRFNRSGVDEPFAREAKEFMRSKLIGRKVTVDIEYLVDSQSQQRKYGTVSMNVKKKNNNIAVLLLQEGLATLIGHKQGAERSHFYHGAVYLFS